MIASVLSILTHSTSFPVLDEEFDKFDALSQAVDHSAVEAVLLPDDLAWDDQLDNGEEMSL